MCHKSCDIKQDGRGKEETVDADAAKEEEIIPDRREAHL
jgi:hypothetical protein